MKIVIQTLSFIFLFSNASIAQWTTLQLNEAQTSLSSVEIANKLIYAGGTPDNQRGSEFYNTYDFSTGELVSQDFDYGGYNYNTATSNNWAIFDRGVGTIVGRFLIYDGATDSWERETLGNSRFGYVLTAYKNEAFFVGGDRDASKEMDIYNVKTKEWRKDTVPGPRINRTAKIIGNRLFLIGGLEGTSSGTSPRTTAVDIYNFDTGQWATTELSEGRTDIAVAVVGDKLYAAGGFKFNNLTSFGATQTMDIIDLNDLSVSTVNLPEVNAAFQAFAVGTKIVFMGGFSSKGTIYDTETGTWTEETLITGDDLAGIKGAVLGKKVYATSAWAEPDKVFIYDSENNSWGEHLLSQSRTSSDINVAGNQLLIAGGRDSDGNTSDAIDIFTDISVVVVTPISANIESIGLSCAGASDGAISITDVSGGTPPFQYSFNGSTPSSANNFRNLPPGIYTLEVIDAVGAVYSETIILTEPAPIQISSTFENPTVGNQNGSICTTLTGGTPPYLFAWANTATTSCLEDLGPGTYVLTVTDANGCIVTETFELEEVVSAYSVNQGIQFEIFPVPANEKVTVKFDRLPKKIAVADMTGKILFTREDIQNLQIEFERKDFSSGVFLLFAEDADGFTNLKKMVFK